MVVGFERVVTTALPVTVLVVTAWKTVLQIVEVGYIFGETTGAPLVRATVTNGPC